MIATSRKVSRKALAALLTAALVGDDKLAQAVYAYPPASFTESPLLFIRSAGTATKRRGIGQTKAYNRFTLEIVTYIAAANSDPGWTPEASADVFDDIEAAVREVLIVNPTNPAWADLEIPDQMTEVYHLSAEQAGGIPFDVEILKVEVKVNDN